MRQTRQLLGLAIVIGLLAALGLAGCGGGKAGPPAGGPPGGGGVPGPATLTGKVVDASDVTVGIPAALITAVGLGRATNSAGDGTFALTGLPVGEVVIEAQFPINPDFNVQRLTLQIPAPPETLDVTIAAVPRRLGTPDSIVVVPDRVNLEVNGTQDFDAVVKNTFGVDMGIEPSWVLRDIGGAIGPTGNFVGSALGAGTVWAVSGAAIGFANVTVTIPGPPTITSVTISPTSLAATGGVVTIVAGVVDADPIGSVVATIRNPDPATFLVNLAETPVGSGTWSAQFTAPGNNNPILPDGTQDPEIYTVVIRATENTAAALFSESAPETFKVKGAEAPPPPPP